MRHVLTLAAAGAALVAVIVIPPSPAYDRLDEAQERYRQAQLASEMDHAGDRDGTPGEHEMSADGTLIAEDDAAWDCAAMGNLECGEW